MTTPVSSSLEEIAVQSSYLKANCVAAHELFSNGDTLGKYRCPLLLSFSHLKQTLLKFNYRWPSLKIETNNGGDESLRQQPLQKSGKKRMNSCLQLTNNRRGKRNLRTAV